MNRQHDPATLGSMNPRVTHIRRDGRARAPNRSPSAHCLLPNSRPLERSSDCSKSLAPGARCESRRAGSARDASGIGCWSSWTSNAARGVVQRSRGGVWRGRGAVGAGRGRVAPRLGAGMSQQTPWSILKNTAPAGVECYFVRTLRLLKATKSEIKPPRVPFLENIECVIDGYLPQQPLPPLWAC